MKKFIEIGKIIRPHGINGAVKTEPWCDSPIVLANLKHVFLPDDESEFKEIKIQKSAVQKDRVILQFEGIETVENAEKLRNSVIYAISDDIPVKDGAFLIADLQQLPVIDFESGKIYGTLNDVIQGSNYDLYEVKTAKGNVLIPAVKEFIKKIDIENAIYISPIKGMFDEN